MLKRYVTSIVLCALLAGCGETYSSISARPYPAEPEEPEAHFHFGGVRLAEPVEGARLSTGGVTDEAGQFAVEGEVGPLVTARVPQGPTLELEVAEEEPGFLWLSPVTTIVSRYHRSHPNVTLAVAEERVRAYLEIPDDVDLGSGLGDTWRSPFSWTAFSEAAGSIPIDAFLDQQVAAVDSGTPHPFRLRDPYRNLRQFLGGAPLGGAHGDFYSAVGTNLVADVANDNLVSVAGWVCEALLLNLPTGDQLEDIHDQFEHVLEELAELQKALPAVEPQLQAPLARILAATESYLRMTPPSNPGVPVEAPPPEAAAFAAELAAYDGLNADLQLLGEQLLGEEGLPMAFARTLQPAEAEGEFLFQNWRTNAILEAETDFLLYYQTYQVLGFNLQAERSHLGPDLATTITAALDALREFAAGVRVAQQQVPPVTIATDDVMVDVPGKVMWYNQMSHLEEEQVEPFLEQFTLGPWKQWRLPTVEELQELRQQALQAGHGNLVSGLQRMGFHLDHAGEFLAEGDVHLDLATGTAVGHTEEEVHVLVARDCPGPGDAPGTLQAVATPTMLDALVAAVLGTTAGARLDYSSLVVWSSSDPARMDVSNLPANLGQLFFHQAPGAAITASLLTGFDPESFVRGSLARLPPSEPPTLTSLVLTPNNLIVSGTNITMQATGQYSDETVRDLTGTVTWSASQGTFEGNVLRAGPGPVTITATANATTARASFSLR